METSAKSRSGSGAAGSVRVFGTDKVGSTLISVTRDEPKVTAEAGIIARIVSTGFVILVVLTYCAQAAHWQYLCRGTLWGGKRKRMSIKSREP